MNKVLLALCALFLLAGCSNTGDLPTAAPEIEEKEVLADCFLYFHLTAWIDENANGELDAGELPLAGVEFRVDGGYASSTSKGRATSDEEGNATVDTWTPGGCPDTFSISATPPEGYTLTTESPVVVTEPFSARVDAAFGFQVSGE